MSSGVITTFTGVRFDVYDPKPEDVRLEDIAHALSFEPRWGGHTRTVVPYTVAQHSVLVSCLVPTLGALLHDAAEAYMRDLATPLKVGAPTAVRGWLDAVELGINSAIGQRFSLGCDWWQTDEIKTADATLLATEARDLMHPDGKQRAKPLDGKLDSIWSHDRALIKFFLRFKELS